MRLIQTCFPVVLLLTSSLPIHAVPTVGSGAHPDHFINSIQTVSQNDEMLLTASLREDVSIHPNEFLVFETQASASQFIESHWTEARRETEWRMISRGVFGYWKNKTVVVLPSLSSANRR